MESLVLVLVILVSVFFSTTLYYGIAYVSLRDLRGPKRKPKLERIRKWLTLRRLRKSYPSLFYSPNYLRINNSLVYAPTDRALIREGSPTWNCEMFPKKIEREVMTQYWSDLDKRLRWVQAEKTHQIEVETLLGLEAES